MKNSEMKIESKPDDSFRNIDIVRILEDFPCMIFIADENGNCEYFNNTWLRFTGKSLEQEKGRGFFNEVYPDDLNRCMNVFLENFPKRIKFSMQFRLRQYTGKYRWIEGHCMPISMNQDNKYKYIGACFDIDDMIESEERNKKFKMAVEQSPLSIVITDNTATIEYVNPKFSEVTGYSYNDAVGKNPRILKSGYHGAAFYEELWQKILSGNTWYGEMHNIKKNKKPYTEEVSISPIKNTEGNITHFVAIKQDVTERRKIEQKLSESEAQFRQIFENMNNCVAIYEVIGDGESFIFKDFNPAAERAEHISKEQVLGKNVLEVFPGMKDFGLLEVLQRVWKTGKQEIHPITQYNDSRISGWRENYVHKLPNGNVIAIYEDITERKRDEEELKKSSELLKTQIIQLEKFNKLTVDRELKMIELKKENERLRQQVMEQKL